MMRSQIFRYFYFGIITVDFSLTSTIVYIIFHSVDIFFCTVFICEFSYVDQFYSFIRAIHLYRFLKQCLSVTHAIS